MRPTGTVTLLFSDIEGSTRLLHAIGVASFEGALTLHRHHMRESFARYAGYEVDTAGDSFFVAFSRAVDAVQAARDAQLALASCEWPDNEPVRVRIGIHSCEVTVSGLGYVGVGVHRAARICAAGHGGQIVISQTTHELLANESSIACIDLGAHPLKDYPQPQRLYQVVDARLQQTFSPLRTPSEGQTNIKAAANPLVGRERELDAICSHLRQPGARLITLTGPGGTGKTRLAVRAAVDLTGEFSDGVFLVELQAIREPELLMSTIAQTLAVRQAAGQSLAAYLAPKEMLLVLDNFEQIIAGAATVAELLVQSPKLRIIVTSREPLRIAGEQVFPVSPLSWPDPQRVTEPDDLFDHPATRLFVERAQGLLPSFQATPRNAKSIAEICARLDGLPLAIELAASRVSMLSPEAMLIRLGDRLKLLAGGARDRPARHQTLRRTLLWSHELLTPDERALFARLAVFVGGFTLEAAEAVCDAEFDTLSALVDRSMVRRIDERFDMMETMRDLALEQLAAAADGDVVRERHMAYFEAMAERVYAKRWHDEQSGLDELDREHDNLRLALDRLHATDGRRLLRLAGALGWFWHMRSHYSEGRARLAQALGAAPGPDEGRARALAAAGELAAFSGELAPARRFIDEAIGLWRAQGRTQEIACALTDLGWGCFYSGDGEARRLMEEGLRLQLSIGDPLLVNRARIGLLQVLVGLGDIDTVEPMAREALALATRDADLRSAHLAVHFLADCSLIRGDHDQALPRYRRSLALAVELGDRAEIAPEIQGVAMVLANCGQGALALQLAGAASAAFEAMAIDLTGMTFWMVLLERHLGTARAALGGDAADAAWQEGRRMPLTSAIALALRENDLPAVRISR